MWHTPEGGVGPTTPRGGFPGRADRRWQTLPVPAGRPARFLPILSIFDPLITVALTLRCVVVVMAQPQHSSRRRSLDRSA